jgi:hypothetical protein
MTSQIQLYNGALRLCKERRLTALTDSSEPRKLLDDAWDDGSTGGAVKHCLQLGQWTFAMRTGMIDYTPSVTPGFGYRYAFSQPSDMVRVSAICSDEYFNSPLTEYADERQYWYSDLQTIYVRWVSNGSGYGADLSLWPESFVKLVESYLALEIVANLTQGEDRVMIVEKAFNKALKSAKSLDAMNKPTMFLPEGSWSRSRRGNNNATRRGGGWAL